MYWDFFGKGNETHKRTHIHIIMLNYFEPLLDVEKCEHNFTVTAAGAKYNRAYLLHRNI